ncbi:MAG: response regulator [Magnetococcus sp. DMHC-1]|nr:response regulator [Magnetococcales bacterium]
MMRILIADDELSNRIIMKKILAPYGECTLVENGKEAVEIFKQALEDKVSFDLVCLDIMMPIVDGLLALQKIRTIEAWNGISEENEVTIFIVTSVDTAETVLRAFMKGGCTDYINKPVSRERIIQKLREHKIIP